jgi:hypothetical protein
MNKSRTEWTFETVPQSFWTTIEQAGGDNQRFRDLLAEVPRDQLREMYWQYRELAQQLFSEEHLDHMDPEASEDTALDIANWVVMQGRDRYLDIYEHPEKTPYTHQGRGPSFHSIIVYVFRERFGEAVV